MKMTYETPVAEVISFTAMEQLATLKDEISLAFGDSNFEAGIGSITGF